MTHCVLCERLLIHQSSWQRFLFGGKKDTICPKCRAEFEKTDAKNSLYQYNEAMKKYIHHYKFLKDIRLATVFADELAIAIKQYDVDVVMPIPMHEQREKERSFAHVDEYLKVANIRYEHLLSKTTSVRQSGKNKEQRLNSSPLFKMKSAVDLSNKKILIVDDLYTTGTTIKHATRILHEANALSVEYFTLIKG